MTETSGDRYEIPRADRVKVHDDLRGFLADLGDWSEEDYQSASDLLEALMDSTEWSRPETGENANLSPDLLEKVMSLFASRIPPFEDEIEGTFQTLIMGFFLGIEWNRRQAQKS